jgi:hypothetical protein
VSFTELTLSRVGIVQPTAEQVLRGYNSVRTFSKAQQAAFAERYLAEHPKTEAQPGPGDPERFTVPQGYDERFDHFVNFFKAVRARKPAYEDATFGYRAATPALLCNESYYQGRSLGWDPVRMQLVS